jgi:hypothetical protein
MRVRRLPHTDCQTYWSCVQCRRSRDTMEMAAGTFGCLVLFTVCPVTVLFVMAAHGIAGMTGAWVAVAFLLSLPALVGLWVWLHPNTESEMTWTTTPRSR